VFIVHTGNNGIAYLNGELGIPIVMAADFPVY
jgi:hypothetical protein